jgi:hypothetical protein
MVDALNYRKILIEEDPRNAPPEDARVLLHIPDPASARCLRQAGPGPGLGLSLGWVAALGSAQGFCGTANQRVRQRRAYG